MSKRESSAEIDEAAALWALRIDDAALDIEAQADFERWLNGNVRHVGAFARAQAVLVTVKRAKALGSTFEPASFTQETNPPGSGEPIARHIADESTAFSLLPRRRFLAGASALAATGALAFFLPIRRAAAQIYETGRGEIRLIPLENGSTVTLNTDSRVEATLNGAYRQVRLVRGEALFMLAAPFLVEAGNASLTAQNATFTVCRLDAGSLAVKVCEGDVEIARSRFPTHRLGANMEATLPSNGAMMERSISPEALARELAWQEGMLSFEDTPLSDAANAFARYSTRLIQINDPVVGAETVTGRFAVNNPEGFARAVALGLNLRVQTTQNGVLLAR